MLFAFWDDPEVVKRILVGVIIFFFGMVRAFIRKEKAANNPWGPGATTLEWTLPSPPPFHQFGVLPLIK